jgi:hypothetical protein
MVRPFESTPNYSEFLGELSFSTFKELGSDRILLVEGVNDVKTVQQLLRLVKKEHSTVILPLGGDQLAAGRHAELSEIKRLSNNIFALVDSERSEVDGPAKQKRIDFEIVCRQLGFSSCITQRRAIENYFPDYAVKAAFGSAYSGLGPFQALRSAPKPWRKSESWRIARYMNFSDIAETDLGIFLKQL